MKHVSPRIREIAARLVMHEAAAGKSVNGGLSAEISALEKLRPRLVILMSNGGFHALLLRARTLAAAEAPWLSGIRINPDGTVEGPGAPIRKPDPKGIAAGNALLLSQLLSLLEAFIGEILTLQLVHETWPEVSLSDPDTGRGDEREKRFKKRGGEHREKQK